MDVQSDNEYGFEPEDKNNDDVPSSGNPTKPKPVRRRSSSAHSERLAGDKVADVEVYTKTEDPPNLHKQLGKRTNSKIMAKIAKSPERKLLKAVRKNSNDGNDASVILSKNPNMNVNYVDIEGKQKNPLWRRPSGHWKELRSALYYACLAKNKRVIEELLRRRADPNQHSSDLSTPLHALFMKSDDINVELNDLVIHECLEAMKRFSDEDLNAGAQNTEGNSPLHLATSLKFLESVEFLVSLNPPVDQGNVQGETPLFLACKLGTYRITKTLLEAKSDPSIACTKQKQTPFLKACELAASPKPAKAPEICEFILKGASKLKVNCLDSSKQTPLCYLVKGKGSPDKRKQLVAKLIKRGARVDLGSPTPLRLAFEVKDKDLTSLLLEAGASPNQPSLKDSKTPAQLAVEQDQVEGFLDAYCKAEMSLEVDALTLDADKLPLLHIASNRGSADAANTLIAHGANVNIKDTTGKALIFRVIENREVEGNEEILKSLVSKKVDTQVVNVNQLSPLQFCCQLLLNSTDSESVEKCLQMICTLPNEVNRCNSDGETPLVLAARALSIPSINYLLDSNSDPNVRTQDGHTPLIEAILEKETDVVSVLASHQSTDLNSKSISNFTPLLAASSHCNPQVFFALQKASTNRSVKLDFDFINDDNEAAIHKALLTKNSNSEVCQSIIMNTPKAVLDSKSKTSERPIWVCIEQRRSDLVETLLRCRVDTDFTGAAKQLTVTPLQLAIYADLDDGICAKIAESTKEAKHLDFKDDRGVCALVEASRKSMYQTVEALLSHTSDADINVTDPKDGNTIVHIAIQQQDEELLDIISKYPAPFDELNAQNRTPLGLAIVQDTDLEIFKTIVRVSVKAINIPDPDSRSPLIKACSMSKFEFAQELLQGDPLPDVNAVDSSTGETAIFIAIKAKQFEVVRNLVRKGANVMIQSKAQDTALHYALRAQYVDEISAFLIENCEDINVQDYEGNTATHLVCNNNAPNLLQLCIDKGANMKLKNNNGYDPMKIGVSSNYDDIVALISMNGGEFEILRSDDDVSALLDAIRSNKSDMIINIIIEKGTDSLEEKLDGLTALQHLVSRDKTRLCRVILQKGADAKILDGDKKSIIHTCIDQDQLETMKTILDIHPDLADLPTGSRAFVPVHWLIRKPDCSNKTEMLDALLKKMTTSFNGLDEHLNTPIMAAITTNDLNLVKSFQPYGDKVDMSLANSEQNSCLHLAVLTGLDEIVSTILTFQGHDTGAINFDGETALTAAIQDDQFSIAKLIVKTKPEFVHVSNRSGQSPLLLAALKDAGDLFQEIKNCKPDLNLKDDEGQTIIQYLLHSRKWSYALNILQLGGIKLDTKDDRDVTPLRTFFTAIADLDFVTPDSEASKLASSLLMHAVDEDKSPEVGLVTILACKKVFRAVELLLKSGFSPDGIVDDKSALMFCLEVETVSESLLCDIARKIKADLIGKKYPNGETALHIACKKGMNSLVKILVERATSSDLNTISQNGEAAASVAFREGQWGSLVVLLTTAEAAKSQVSIQNIFISSSDGTNISLIDAAIRMKDYNLMQYCVHQLKQNIPPLTSVLALQPNAQNHRFMERASLLWLNQTVLRKSGRSIQDVLKHKDQFGMTALHKAVALEALDVMDVLINSGIDINEPDGEGRTALLIALTQGSNDDVTKRMVHKLRNSNWHQMNQSIDKSPAWACFGRDLQTETVQYLDLALKYDPNVARYETDDLNMLTVAIAKNDVNMAQTLLTAGAQIKGLSGTYLDKMLESIIQTEVWSPKQVLNTAVIAPDCSVELDMSHPRYQMYQLLTSSRITQVYQPQQSDTKTDSPNRRHDKTYDVFISYQWSSEGSPDSKDRKYANNVATYLTNSLESLSVKVWRDKEQLESGSKELDRAFISGLKDSILFMPLISEAVLTRMQNMKDGETNNVLCEWDTAIDTFDALVEDGQRYRLQIFPVIVGKFDEEHNPLNFNFPGFFNDALNTFPSVYAYHNKDSKFRTVAETVNRMSKLTCNNLKPTEDSCREMSRQVRDFLQNPQNDFAVQAIENAGRLLTERKNSHDNVNELLSLPVFDARSSERQAYFTGADHPSVVVKQLLEEVNERKRLNAQAKEECESFCKHRNEEREREKIAEMDRLRDAVNNVSNNVENSWD